MNDYLAAIDAGTGGVRCVIFDVKGNVVSQDYRETLTMYTPAGHAEQDPVQLVEAALNAVRGAIVKGNVDAVRIAGITTTGTQTTFAAVDRQGNFLTNIILWQDMRGIEMFPWIRQRLAEHGMTEAELYRRTFRPLNALSAGAKLLWLCKHEPALYGDIHKLVNPQAILLRALGAEEVTIDPTDGGWWLSHDSATLEIDPELVEVFDLNTDFFPRFCAPGEQVGKVTLDVAERTGLKAGTPIYQGAVDQCCAALGAGNYGSPETGTMCMGTAGVIMMYSDVPIPDPLGRYPVIHFPSGGYVSEIGVRVAASAFRWVRDMLYPSEDLNRNDIYQRMDKYISEALHKMRPQTFIVWLFKDVEAAKAKYAIPDYVRCVEWKMPMSNFFLGRARVIVDNWQKPDWLRLGREQVYLFSPHHDRSLKSGGFLKKDRLYNRMVESQASVITTGSDFNKRFLRKAAHFNGPYLDFGLPRNDILVRDDPADEERIRRCLGIEAETKILLFAPTYRDLNRREGCRETVTLDINRVLDVLEEATHDRWVCLYRAHYLSLGLNLDHLSKSPRLMDVTDYPEMAELLRIADAMISDYSCAAGDFALRGKPIWLYVADIDEYTKYSRKFYVNPLDTPYWCARTSAELEALIRQTTPDKAAKNCQDVLEYYGAHETGRASEIAANYICDILDKYPVIRAKRLWVEETEEGEFRDMPMEFHNDLIDALSARASMSDVI